MKNFLYLSLFMTCILNTSTANTIALNELGGLSLKFEPVTQVKYFPLNPFLAEVSIRSGDAFVLTTPTNIQQLSYLVGNGEWVTKGQVFVELKGPEVHHFVAEFEATKKLYLIAKNRLDNNEKLFRDKLIKEEKWLAINKYYYAIYLQYEHLHHFYDLIASINEQQHSITLKAPISGLFNQPSFNGKYSEGDKIAKFIPESKIRLRVKVPYNQIDDLAFIKLNDCKLEIEFIDRVVKSAFVDVWTHSMAKQCNVFFGQELRVLPFYRKEVYKVNKSALFNIEGSAFILVREKQQLRAVEVSIITAKGTNYLVSASINLSNVHILTSSVSAVQGMLMGLGGE